MPCAFGTWRVSLERQLVKHTLDGFRTDRWQLPVDLGERQWGSLERQLVKHTLDGFRTDRWQLPADLG